MMSDTTRERETAAKPVKFWRRRLVVLGVAAGLLAVAALGLLLHFMMPLFTGPALTRLTVGGKLQHVDPAAVRLMVQPKVGTGFFNTDVEMVSAAVEQLPWVAEAKVRREWPHTLYIDIVEEVPVARWNDDGLLDARGKVFTHGQDPVYAKLPLLSGRDGDQADVLAQYNTLLDLMMPRGLTIAELTVDARGAATVLLSDGIEVRLGREAAAERLTRFAAVALPALGPRLATVTYVDMRYTNGFAVGWKGAAMAAPAGNGGSKPNV
jgi:cell division protein FtsQ